MHLIPDVPSSPRLIKSESMSSIESYSSQEDVIDSILNDLIDDICDSLSEKKKSVYKYVRIQRQALVYTLVNYLYFICTAIKLIKYHRIYRVKDAVCLVDNQHMKLKVDNIHIRDDCVQLNRLKIPYEYIKYIQKHEKKIMLTLIPNERSVNKIMINTKQDDVNVLKKINTNMHYHMRYHKLDNNAIKYYQKFFRSPIETY